MLKLFPKVILADKQTELHLNGDELKGGTKVAFFYYFSAMFIFSQYTFRACRFYTTALD